MGPGEIYPDLFAIVAVKGGAAILCGGMIGLERQLLGKPAGLRVCILVVFTTSYFMTIAGEITDDANALARVIAATITGVGFLGAGVIFRGDGRVSGITTASLIWALAAIGCTIGLGHPLVAIAVTVAIMVVLGLVDIAEHLFPRLRQEVDVSGNDRRDRKSR